MPEIIEDQTGKPLIFVESLEEAISILGDENWSYPIVFNIMDNEIAIELDNRFHETYKAVSWSIDGMVKYVRN